MAIVHGRSLEKALVDRGIVPPNCKLLEIVMAPNAVTVLRFETFVSAEDLGKLAEAFTEAAQAVKPPMGIADYLKSVGESA